MSALTRAETLLATPQATQLKADLTRTYERLTQRPVALYGTAILRIGYGLLYFVYLLHELPNVQRLWGPNAPWTPAMDRALARSSNWPGWIQRWYTLLASGNVTYVELFYLVALVVCLLFAAGWHTRFLAICFMVVVTSFQGRSVLVTDGGDNVQVLMAIYLTFTASGRRWSLDARRKAQGKGRSGAAQWLEANFGEVRLAGRRISEVRLSVDAAEMRRRVVAILHNCAVLVIAYEMCIIYGAAALFKVQGSMWQDGTALYYALHVNWFTPWPGLSHWVASHAMMMVIGSYVTVFVQLALPFTLFAGKLKYLALAVLMSMHINITILMGLPVFSLSMLIGDAILLPDAFWRFVARVVKTTGVHLIRIVAARTGVVSMPPVDVEDSRDVVRV